VPHRKIPLILTEADVQRVVQAVLDRDSDAALEFLKTVIHPQIEAAQAAPHCKPVFELPRGERSSPIRPPSLSDESKTSP